MSSTLSWSATFPLHRTLALVGWVVGCVAIPGAWWWDATARALPLDVDTLLALYVSSPLHWGLLAAPMTLAFVGLCAGLYRDGSGVRVSGRRDLEVTAGPRLVLAPSLGAEVQAA